MKKYRESFQLLVLVIICVISSIAYSAEEDSVIPLLPLILFDLMEGESSETMVSDGCVTIPMIAAGSRIVNNVNFTSGSSSVRDITFTSFSATEFNTTDMTTTTVFGVSSSIETSMSVLITITDDMLFINSIDSTIVSGNTVTTSEVNYTPAFSRGPYPEYCSGQTWTEPSVSQEQAVNGVIIGTTLTSVSEGIVNSINEIIQLPAGTFTTVKKTLTTADIDNVHIEWVDIATGHIVKIEEYDDNGNSLRWRSEAQLIE